MKFVWTQTFGQASDVNAELDLLMRLACAQVCYILSYEYHCFIHLKQLRMLYVYKKITIPYQMLMNVLNCLIW